jgi:putative transposase
LRVTGHLFQGRFGCVARDEPHLMAALRYVALNPVKAKWAATAADGPWSSTPAHLRRQDDGLVTVYRVDRFADFLAVPADPEQVAALTKGQAIGRPPSQKNDPRQPKLV